MLAALGGDKSKLVIDLSCRRQGDSDKWVVAMNKWQTLTDMEVNQGIEIRQDMKEEKSHPHSLSLHNISSRREATSTNARETDK